jgi:heme oxygenase (biliverdin-IX-beta and delta-forming)
MNLERLKSETQPDHEATESAMPLMDSALTRDKYAQILCRLYPVVRSWEEWAAAHAPQDLLATIQGRQRAQLIEQDLRVLGHTFEGESMLFPSDRIPGLQAGSPYFRSTFLGAMYVMEGSTLGGQFIARHMEEMLGLNPGEGDAYFRGHGARTGEMWRAFKSVLAEVPENHSDHVIAAAKAMFGTFRRGMLQPV